MRKKKRTAKKPKTSMRKKKRAAKKSKISAGVRKVEMPRVSDSGDEKLEKILVENFVSLQKVMVNLSVKFDNLANQISKLLDLFEISAKALAEKDFKIEKEGKDTKEILKKVDNLFEQNKVIARGLTLLHEGPESEQTLPPPTPLKRPVASSPKAFGPDVEGYQKSISSDGSLEPAPISEEESGG